MYEERPQRYGTQSYQTNVGGETVIYVWPVEHPEQLDSLREAIGTCPMAEYVRLLEETSGAQVVYDPALTVDSLKRIVGKRPFSDPPGGSTIPHFGCGPGLAVRTRAGLTVASLPDKRGNPKPVLSGAGMA